MRRTAPIGAPLIAALLTAGCADVRAALQQVFHGITEPQSQSRGATAVSDAQAVPTGPANPPQPAPGPNRTVDVCRKAVRAEAVKLGAREIEAVPAGPEQMDKKGQRVAPVHVRITYGKPAGGYEVREATLMCVVDQAGKFVDAFDPLKRAAESKRPPS